MLSAEQINAYHDNGFLLVPEVFSEGEMAAFSAAARANSAAGAVDQKSLFTVPGLEDLWADERLIGMARDLLGPELVFFGEAGYTRYRFAPGENMKGRHLHHDAKGTREHLFSRLHSIPPLPYPVMRMGIYFQDFTAQSGGLKVSPGSHKKPTDHFVDTDLPHFNVPSKPGDVVCFTMRLLHSPFGMRLKSDPGRGLAPSKENMLFAEDPGVFEPHPLERETFFIDYAARHELADLHIKSRTLNPANKKTGAAAVFAEGRVAKRAQEKNVTLRYDYALQEILRDLTAHVLPDGMQKSGKPYLRLLARLRQENEEWSQYYRLSDAALVDDGSLQAAWNIYQDMMSRAAGYRATYNTRVKDAHMIERAHMVKAPS